jgi:hypothetical protein
MMPVMMDSHGNPGMAGSAIGVWILEEAAVDSSEALTMFVVSIGVDTNALVISRLVAELAVATLLVSAIEVLERVELSAVVALVEPDADVDVATLVMVLVTMFWGF